MHSIFISTRKCFDYTTESYIIKQYNEEKKRIEKKVKKNRLENEFKDVTELKIERTL